MALSPKDSWLFHDSLILLPDAEQMLLSHIDDTIPESPEALAECVDDMDLMSDTTGEIEAFDHVLRFESSAGKRYSRARITSRL